MYGFDKLSSNSISSSGSKMVGVALGDFDVVGLALGKYLGVGAIDFVGCWDGEAEG